MPSTGLTVNQLVDGTPTMESPFVYGLQWQANKGS